MNDPAILERFRQAVRERARLAERITALRDRQRLAVDRRGRRRREAALDSRLREASGSLRRCEEAIKAERPALEAALGRVDDPDTRAVLRLYYADGHSDEQAAERLWLSARRVSRLRRDWLARGVGS